MYDQKQHKNRYKKFHISTANAFVLRYSLPESSGGGSLMVSEHVSGSSGPGSSPGRGHCVVFLGKALYSHSASLQPGV